MTRSLWTRALVGVWGLWLTTSMSGMAGLHQSHGALGHTAAHMHAMDMGTAPTAAPMVGHTGHHDARATSTTCEIASKDDSHHSPAGFACLEQCCCGTPLAIAARTVPLSANPRANALLQPYAETVTASARRAHSQPFANGPPTAV